jgi:hypothetical protein
MRPRIHQRPRIPTNLAVIPLALEIDADLLHVCCPVDFGVCKNDIEISWGGGRELGGWRRTCDFFDDDAAEGGIEDQEEWDEPFCVEGVGREVVQAGWERHFSFVMGVVGDGG